MHEFVRLAYRLAEFPAPVLRTRRDCSSIHAARHLVEVLLSHAPSFRTKRMAFEKFDAGRRVMSGLAGSRFGGMKCYKL